MLSALKEDVLRLGDSKLNKSPNTKMMYTSPIPKNKISDSAFK